MNLSNNTRRKIRISINISMTVESRIMDSRKWIQWIFRLSFQLNHWLIHRPMSSQTVLCFNESWLPNNELMRQKVKLIWRKLTRVTNHTMLMKLWQVCRLLTELLFHQFMIRSNSLMINSYRLFLKNKNQNCKKYKKYRRR